MKIRKALVAATVTLLAVQFAPASPGSATGVDKASAYFGNSLICKQADGPRCQLWLDADGRYQIFYDMGAQPAPPVAGSRFRLEGRSGHYTLRTSSVGQELCLKPDPTPGVQRGSVASNLPFAGAGCYPFPAHALGDSWQSSGSGPAFTFWLVAGR